MKKNKFILYLIYSLLVFSCTETTVSELKPDIKIVELNYNFQNYNDYIRDKSDPIIIKERNFLEIDVDSIGNCMIEKVNIDNSHIVNELKKYFIGDPANPSMPATALKTFEFSGEVYVNTNLLISVAFDKKISYQKYQHIRSQIFKAHFKVKNNFALSKFKKSLNQLIHSEQVTDRQKYYEILEIFPIRYTEVLEN